jgi:membrane protein CcdC involved in cytochrome C biogenesis
MFRAVILPIFRSTRLCVTACGIMYPRCCRPLLLHLVGCLYYLYQWFMVKQMAHNEIYLLIKYIKSVPWRVAKRLSYIEDARCLKVNITSTHKTQSMDHGSVLTPVMKLRNAPITCSFSMCLCLSVCLHWTWPNVTNHELISRFSCHLVLASFTKICQTF